MEATLVTILPLSGLIWFIILPLSVLVAYEEFEVECLLYYFVTPNYIYTS